MHVRRSEENSSLYEITQSDRVGIHVITMLIDNEEIVIGVVNQTNL